MSLRLDHLRPATLSILAALTVGGALVAAPAAHGAATSVSVSGTTGVITLDGADDTVRVVTGAGNLSHGLKTSGGCLTCFSDFDWDSSTPLVEEPLAASPATQVVLNGGDGDDGLTAPQGAGDVLKATLDGEGGNDLLIGSAAADDVRGGLGDDRIVGGRGNDTMNGGAGDDTLVASNGDGSDVINGDDGRDVVEVHGSPAAGDAFSVSPNASRVKLERTSLVPFTLDIGTTEAMALHSLGGDDTIVVGEVGAFQVAADGGSGNDSLTGASGAETFLGGSGNDTITPGLGIDSVAGDEGDDRVAVRDGLVDFTRCGAGTDQVTADAVALDAGMEGCETVDRPPTVDPTSPPTTTPTPGPMSTASTVRPVAISSATVKIKKGKGKIVFACPSTNLCRVRLNLLAGATASGINVVVVLARASFELRPGEAKSVRIEVPKRAGELANRKGRLSVLAVATTTGPSSTSATRTQRLTLDFGKPKKKGGR